MGLLILKGGLLDTLQDQGRWGYASWGVNTGGAADTFAASTANLLLGNPLDEGVLEMHFPALQLRFEKETWFALSGANFSPALNGFEIPLNRPVQAYANDVLVFRKHQWGARCYLAIQDGLGGSQWLGSRSTQLKLPDLGLLGRKLKEGDQIPYAGLSSKLFQKGPNQWFASIEKNYENLNELRVLPGREWDWLDASTQNQILLEEFRILPQSDRMGYRLSASAVAPSFKKEMISTGVRFGTVQLLPSGQLIVLMADHQTTGGYPRLVEVITADLSKLAQLKQGDCFRFKMIDGETAEDLFFKQQQLLKKRAWAAKYQWNIL